MNSPEKKIKQDWKSNEAWSSPVEIRAEKPGFKRFKKVKKILEKLGIPTSNFIQESLNLLDDCECPHEKGIYVISSENDDNIIYVGKAEDIRERIENHLKGQSSNKALSEMVKRGTTLNVRWALSEKPFASEDLALVLLDPEVNVASPGWNKGAFAKASMSDLLNEARRLGFISSNDETVDTNIVNNFVSKVLGVDLENIEDRQQLINKIAKFISVEEKENTPTTQPESQDESLTTELLESVTEDLGANEDIQSTSPEAQNEELIEELSDFVDESEKYIGEDVYEE